ncbi:hypothetical protein RSO01_89820 [Reyranella soli]|jgi:heme/copper-type cytochrome/quinol oxidase subunit 1|uniref:Cytochrome b561 domain-containing protein n=2 Tax=Reyranella soli TaxID=1230389 RepID=A0A512NS91_9HYPH|nr:hypothetical protein RSO01_89820 [Reyranella soli]
MRGNWRSRNPMLANALATVIAAWLVGFGAYGVLRDDLAVPASRRYGGAKHYYHFHGVAAWLIFAGFACLGASIILVVYRRLKATPSGMADPRVALVVGTAGALIILTMLITKWVES